MDKQSHKINYTNRIFTNARILLLAGCVDLLFTPIHSQNLIYNPNCELWVDTTSFLVFESETNFINIDGWFTNSQAQFSSRNLTVYNGQGANYSNYRNYNQLFVRSGKGALRNGGSINYLNPPSAFGQKAILQTKLTDSLSTKCYYKFQIYLRPVTSRGTLELFLNGSWSISNALGFYFSEERPRDTTSPLNETYNHMNIQPQLELPRNSHITDTTQWTLFEGTFRAEGGETYLTIANFGSIDSVQYFYLPDSTLYYRWQLPNLVSGWGFFMDDLSLVAVPPPDSVLQSSRDTSICTGDSLVLHAQGDGALWYQWSNGSQDSTTVVTQPGTYWVTAGFGCGFSLVDTISVTALPDNPPVISPQDTTVCPGAQVPLYVPWPDAITYQWSTGSTDSVLWVSQPGDYTISATVPCGHTRETTIVVSPGAPLPAVPFPNDTLLCDGDALEVELLPNLSYQLNGNPIIGTSIAIFQAGIYEITARNACYETQHTFVVEEDACESSIWIPNAFTPNGDGLNECFGPVVTNITNREYSFVITNRWGAVVFQSNEPGACWDGIHNGEITSGVHTYRLTYRDSRGKFHERFGHVTVL